MPLRAVKHNHALIQKMKNCSKVALFGRLTGPVWECLALPTNPLVSVTEWLCCASICTCDEENLRSMP